MKTTQYTIEGDPLSIRALFAKHPFLGNRPVYTAKVLSRYFAQAVFKRATSISNIEKYCMQFGAIKLNECDE